MHEAYCYVSCILAYWASMTELENNLIITLVRLPIYKLLFIKSTGSLIKGARQNNELCVSVLLPFNYSSLSSLLSEALSISSFTLSIKSCLISIRSSFSGDSTDSVSASPSV